MQTFGSITGTPVSGLMIQDYLVHPWGPTSNGTRDFQTFSMTWQVQLWAAILLPWTSRIYLYMCQLHFWKSKYFHFWEMYKGWQDESGVLAAQSGASVPAQCASCTSSGFSNLVVFPDVKIWNMRVESQDICRGW